MALLLALICAFNLAFLLEHFLSRPLTRTFGGPDVVPHATLGHGTILALNHLGFHGLLLLHAHSGHNGLGDCWFCC